MGLHVLAVMLPTSVGMPAAIRCAQNRSAAYRKLAMVLADRCAACRCRVHERMSPSTLPAVVCALFVPVTQLCALRALCSPATFGGEKAFPQLSGMELAGGRGRRRAHPVA
ncbi:MAG: hypothetical protein ACREQ3_17870 [Candidatus Binatia bacterium]